MSETIEILLFSEHVKILLRANLSVASVSGGFGQSGVLIFDLLQLGLQFPLLIFK